MTTQPTEIPDIYMLRSLGLAPAGRIQLDGTISMTATTGQINYVIGEKIQIENSVGYKCCMDQLNYEIYQVNNFIQNTEIVFQLKKTSIHYDDVDGPGLKMKCVDGYIDSMGVKHQIYVDYAGTKYSYGSPLQDEIHYDEMGIVNDDGIVFI
tara:strand:+ start:71 stop:526 length:456 start_codon:yes stop_codon:yes gene_type:complete